MSNKTYAVIGSGAVGAFYGAKLAHSGADVHFLFHSDYEAVLHSGLQVNSCDGSFHLDNVKAYSSPSDMPQVDVVLVGLKTVKENLLATLLPPLLKKDTIVILIQNGIGVEEDVQQMFPTTQLVAGLAFICSAKTKPATVDHQCYGSINLAPFSIRSDDDFCIVIGDFLAAGIETHVVPYAEARWKKAVWNMPFNGLTVALNTQTDLLLANEHTESLVRNLMLEVIGAANALGVSELKSDFAEQMINMTRAMVPYSPSMKLDYDFHRPMEIPYLYTRPIAKAAEAGFAMPRMQMLESQLQFLQDHSNLRK